MNLWACVCGDTLCAAPDEVYDCCRAKGITEAPNTFVTYEMVDGSLIYGEYKWVTELEFFDDRDDEIFLIEEDIPACLRGGGRDAQSAPHRTGRRQRRWLRSDLAHRVAR